MQEHSVSRLRCVFYLFLPSILFSSVLPSLGTSLILFHGKIGELRQTDCSVTDCPQSFGFSGEQIGQRLPSRINVLRFAVTAAEIKVLATLWTEPLAVFFAQNFGRQFQHQISSYQLFQIKNAILADNVIEFLIIRIGVP